MTSPAISVVVPMHNEQMVLPELLRRVGSVLSEMPGGPHEMIFVDDGSSDGTLQILEEAASGDTRISVIVFARNFGHQPALTAALDYVFGRCHRDSRRRSTGSSGIDSRAGGEIPGRI